MIIYNESSNQFVSDVIDQMIADKLKSEIEKKMHRTTNDAEYNSWGNSLGWVMNALLAGNIPGDAGVAIEYNIPQTAKRVDVIVTGIDENDQKNAVIIELKQWSEIQAVPGMDAVVDTFVAHSLRRVAHPSYQAWSYASMISDYNTNVQSGDINLHPCAFLHNYIRKENDDPLDAPQYKECEELSPAFTKGSAKDLGKFIAKYITKGDSAQTIYEIDNGEIKPSKSLQDCLVSMIEGNREFIMIDDQKVVYETIKQKSQQSHADKKKRVIIVKGGPGTGKTVVAINLLAYLTKDDKQVVQYASSNQAPRMVYIDKLKHADVKKLHGIKRKSDIGMLFRGTGAYADIPNNLIDTILVDEAHRLKLRTQYAGKNSENQIKEIIAAAKCSVFFIDEEQRVTTSDIGSVDAIKHWAKKENAEITEMELASQFRCNGSDGYLAWIDNTLQIRQTANFDLRDANYDFRVCDSPEELKKLIVEKNKINNKSRIVAGYCWAWPKNGRNDPDYHDIKIGDFEMSWNFSNDIWATDPKSIDQAGCIHTSQGLEFDYIGVIIGPDMCCRNGIVCTDFTQRAKTDQSIKGLKKMSKEEPDKAKKLADEIIKNTYRTLMTRGMKGCYIYCTDHELSEYFRKCMH